MITLLLLVRATYIWVLFFAHIPFVVNHTFNATPNQGVATLTYDTWKFKVPMKELDNDVRLLLTPVSTAKKVKIKGP